MTPDTMQYYFSFSRHDVTLTDREQDERAATEATNPLAGRYFPLERKLGLALHSS